MAREVRCPECNAPQRVERSKDGTYICQFQEQGCGGWWILRANVMLIPEYFVQEVAKWQLVTSGEEARKV